MSKTIHEELKAVALAAEELNARIEREAIQHVKDAGHIKIDQLSRVVHERTYRASRKHARGVIDRLVDAGRLVLDVNMELVVGED